MSWCSYKLPSPIFFSSVSSFLQKKIKTINEFVSSLYNLKACQILSTEINKIKIDCTQNATNNNQVLLIHQSIYCGNAYIPETKKIKFLNLFLFFTLSGAFIYIFNNNDIRCYNIL